ncbi:MAG: DMT family transporter [Thermoleophilia bacterium]
MIAVLGGLIAAAAWGCSTIFASRASRQIGAESTLGWVGIGGAIVITPIALVYGIKPGTEWTDWLLVLVGATGSVVGLRFTYKALSQGKVGVVVAITSTEGAIAAAIAFALGAPFGLVAGLGIMLATMGVAAVGLGRHAADSAEAIRDNRKAAINAAVAAGVFGSSLYVSGDVASRVGPPWVVMGARWLGILTMALPQLLRGRFSAARPALFFALFAGALESSGFLGFLWGAETNVGIAAVVATQYATIATLISWLFLHERLSRVQLAGVAAVVSGVILLSVSGTT